MQIPSNISDECTDALVELAFIRLASCDPDEVITFIGAILLITEREVGRAVTEERVRLNERVRTPCSN
jgi:hypothetical protein